MKFLKFRNGAVGSGILFFVFFFMMVIIAVGLVGGAYSFFGRGYDSREFESQQLFNQFKNCLSNNDFFQNGFVEDKSLFFDTCRMSKEVLEDGKHLVYLRKLSNNNEFFVGVYDFKVRCGLDASLKNRELPRCRAETFGDYELIVGSSQNARRVSV